MTFDIKAAQAEVEKELHEERMEVVKEKLKASLKTVKTAEKVLANARREHELLLAELSDDGGA